PVVTRVPFRSIRTAVPAPAEVLTETTAVLAAAEMAAARVCPLRGLTGGPDTAGSTVADFDELSDPPVRVRTTAGSAAIAVSPIAATAQFARDCRGGVRGRGGGGCTLVAASTRGSGGASGPAANGFSPSRARRARSDSARQSPAQRCLR